MGVFWFGIKVCVGFGSHVFDKNSEPQSSSEIIRPGGPGQELWGPVAAHIP